MTGRLPHASSRALVSIQSLRVEFGARVLFDDLSFAVQPKERIAFAGHNGAGKSTLMKCIAGIIEPSGGKISKPKGSRVGYLPQEPSVFRKLTVFENVMAILETRAGLTRSDLQAVLREKYSPYFQDAPEIVVEISASQRSYWVLGEVTREGSYPFRGNQNIIDAIVQARPKKDTANLGRILLSQRDFLSRRTKGIGGHVLRALKDRDQLFGRLDFFQSHMTRHIGERPNMHAVPALIIRR